MEKLYNAKSQRVDALLAFLFTTECAVMLDSIILAINTKSIPLTQGKYAIVDADNYEWLMQWKWSYRDGYAKRSVHIPMAAGLRKQVPITMHGVILPPCNGLVPDHINGNGLDNRRENLRLATQQQNTWLS